MPPLIQFEQVTMRFSGVVALSGVSFEIAPGSCHAIVGENGAGKSTLMKILSGVIPDFEGTLRLRGIPTRFSGTRAAEQAGIGIIHQELNLVEQLSAAANLFLGRERRDRLGLLDDAGMERTARELFRELECHIDPRRPVGELRVGDQQLVEIAKALTTETDVLIMDEPTSALTETEVERLFRVLRRLRERGVTILYISHKMDEIFRLADVITVLRDGSVVKTLPRAEATARGLAHLMVGREIEEIHRETATKSDETVLEVRNLSVPWPGHARQWRLREISFTLRRGEILGIAGLMGAGRTELLEALYGSSTEPPRGEILLQGRPVTFQHPAEAQQAGMAFLSEDRKRLGLFPQMTIRENITLGILPELTQLSLISRRRERAAATTAMNQFGVRAATPETLITRLSGGNQQKALLARCLLPRPKIILLDDPTRGVDVGSKAELYRLIHHLSQQAISVLITSSELPELFLVCDRLLVLCEGRLTGEFTREAFSKQKVMEAATGQKV